MVEPREEILLAGKVTAEALEEGVRLAKEGVLLLDVATKVEDFIANSDAFPAFPVNIAIDSQAAHYTPVENDTLVFKRGDLVKIDVGAHVDGYIGDAAVTIEIGTSKWTRMIEASRQALDRAISMVIPGTEISQIGVAVSEEIKAMGYLPISNLTGHNLKKYELHAGKSIPNVPDSGSGVIEIGDHIAIEPFATNGAGEVVNGKPSNIYIFAGKRKMSDSKQQGLSDFISENFSTLPFASRWCTVCEDYDSKTFSRLVKRGVLHSYPILTDRKGGLVTQAEKSVYVTESGPVITTEYRI